MAGVKDHGIGSQAVGVQTLPHRASFPHLPQGAVRALTTPPWEQWQRGRIQILIISITEAEMEAQRGGITSPKPHSKKEAEPEFDLHSWWRGTLCHSSPLLPNPPLPQSLLSPSCYFRRVRYSKPWMLWWEVSGGNIHFKGPERREFSGSHTVILWPNQDWTLSGQTLVSVPPTHVSVSLMGRSPPFQLPAQPSPPLGYRK